MVCGQFDGAFLWLAVEEEWVTLDVPEVAGGRRDVAGGDVMHASA